jgi:hypothetical protein
MPTTRAACWVDSRGVCNGIRSTRSKGTVAEYPAGLCTGPGSSAGTSPRGAGASVGGTACSRPGEGWDPWPGAFAEADGVASNGVACGGAACGGVACGGAACGAAPAGRGLSPACTTGPVSLPDATCAAETACRYGLAGSARRWGGVSRCGCGRTAGFCRPVAGGRWPVTGGCEPVTGRLAVGGPAVGGPAGSGFVSSGHWPGPSTIFTFSKTSSRLRLRHTSAPLSEAGVLSSPKASPAGPPSSSAADITVTLASMRMPMRVIGCAAFPAARTGTRPVSPRSRR